MELSVIVPEQTKIKEVRSVNINLADKFAVVEIWTDGNKRDRIEVKLDPVLKKMTAPQKTIIKGFITKLISLASGTETVDIPQDKIFPELISEIISEK